MALGVMGADEAAKVWEQEKRDFWERTVWQHDPKIRVLRHTETNYEIDLDRCRDAAEILNWLAQIRGKGRTYSDAEFGELFNALNYRIEFQKTVCRRHGWDSNATLRNALVTLLHALAKDVQHEFSEDLVSASEHWTLTVTPVFGDGRWQDVPHTLMCSVLMHLFDGRAAKYEWTQGSKDAPAIEVAELESGEESIKI